MKIAHNNFLFILIFLTSLILTGCGSSGGSSTPPPPAPTGVSATAKDGYVLLNATVASDATGVNVYWSTSSGVTKANGTKIVVGSTPQAHTGLTNGTTYYYVVTTVSASGESAESAQVSATPVAVAIAATVGNDPFYAAQWHIKNTGQQGATGISGATSQDLNVEPVWLLNPAITGAGIRIAVVDDGLEIGHEDLASNIASNELSFNYVTGSNDPTNPADDTSEQNGHGTAVGGIIAARGFNGIGVSGVAPRANMVGYNFLKNGTTSNFVDAMTRGATAVHISNNSWGYSPGNGNLAAAPSIARDAINTGLTTGRGGKGTIYVFAAGNGAPHSNANYKGTSNAHGTIVVGAVNDQGVKSVYSEQGASLWVSAPGGEYCDTHTITTTDRSGNSGSNLNATTTDNANRNYTKCMNGTSAATPGVSGVIALMLEARPELGWRDVRLILAETARQNDTGNAGWFVTGSGKQFNHNYGFGVVDAAAAVARAKTWTLISGAEATLSPTSVAPNTPIPDATGGNGNPIIPGTSITSTITVASGAVSNIEYVEITFSAANHTYMGDLEVTLTSPAGKVSRLAEWHACMDKSTPPVAAACTTSYDNWVFGSSAHLGESPAGTWTLTVTDKGVGDTGTLQSWGLKFYGR